ncbi:TauD/TfdA family dioxygenase [Nocardia sp. NPDC059239]|uniref:TauD/TfdA family dioxygenase n=1 Tax=Nocardia sp. NPDC059239 TaxID=3346785 RepID=UPI00368ABCE5
MTTPLAIHNPSSGIDRLTALDLPSTLHHHISWLDKAFPAADFPSPEHQDRARRALEERVDGLASLLSRATTAIHDDHAVVLRGLPAESTAMVVAITSAVGPVVPSRPDRPLIDDIRPTPGEEDKQSTRLGDRRVALTPHTDNSTMSTPPAVLALAFVRNDDPDSGGESTLTHIDDVAAALDTTDVELLCEPRYPSLNVPTDAGRTPTLTSVLTRHNDGRLTARYRDEALDAGIASSHAPDSPSNAHLDALRRFTSTVRDPARQTRVRLESGDLLIIDNTRFLHGRTEISPHARRHLKRLYTQLSDNSRTSK